MQEVRPPCLPRRMRLIHPIRPLRLKLKVRSDASCHIVATLTYPMQCDRVFPCQSCCKRGCAEICPDGALTGGKGSRSARIIRETHTHQLTPTRRFILANTEQLHEKIKSMSGRIRELEDALGELHPGHALLRDELLTIKKSTELFGVDPSTPQAPATEGNRRTEFQQSLPSSSSPLRDDVSKHTVRLAQWLNLHGPATKSLSLVLQW